MHQAVTKQHARANPIYRPLRLMPKKEGREKGGQACHGKSSSKDTIDTIPHMRPPKTQVRCLKKLLKILGRKVVNIKRARPPHIQKVEKDANPTPHKPCGGEK